MPTPSLLHVAQKGSFKIFKSKKHGETLAIFFWRAHVSIVDCLSIALLKSTIF
jgi:hypothetical protein